MAALQHTPLGAQSPGADGARLRVGAAPLTIIRLPQVLQVLQLAQFLPQLALAVEQC